MKKACGSRGISYPDRAVVANSSIYSSGKTAINAVMKIAAVELAQRKIRVSAISPGPIETKILNKAGYSEEELKGIKAWIINNLPLRQMGKASDVAKLVVYLSGEGSGFITGSETLIDGGELVKAVFSMIDRLSANFSYFFGPMINYKSLHISNAVLFSILFLTQTRTFGQKAEFFKGVDFDSSYTIIGMVQGYDKPVDSFSRFWFVIDDPIEMNRLKRKWVFNRQISKVSYGDVSFDIFIIKDKRLAARSGLIYLKQRIVTPGNGCWYPFDTAELARLHAMRPLRYHKEKKVFDTWQQYAAYGNSIMQDPNLLFFFEPSSRYEGTFDIIARRTRDPDSPIFVLSDINKELAKLTARANFDARHVINDSFNITHPDKVKITVYCSKDLFTQYSVKGREKGSWQPAPIEITTFWRDDQAIP